MANQGKTMDCSEIKSIEKNAQSIWTKN